MFGKNKQPKEDKKTRVPLKDRTLANDIKFRGFFSYRYVRILAWVLLVLVQIGVVVKFNIKVSPSSAAQLQWMVDASSYISDLPLALFLLANFAVIFQKRNNWKQLLMFYGGVAALLYIVGNVAIIHYGFGIVGTFFGKNDFLVEAKAFGTYLANLGNLGYTFNIFIDLFLCSLIFFFVFYTPKDGFKTDKKRLIFRLLIILPILYEIGSIILKYQVAMGAYQIPFFLFFLLTSKPPLMFLSFLAIVLFAKLFELKRIEKHSEEFALEHAKTNAHSLRFSIMISIIFFVAAVIDLIVFFGASVAVAVGLGGDDEAVINAMNVIQSLGFGNSFALLLIIPIVIFFSYTKTHKNPKLDKLVPIGGVGLIAFVFLEGFFQVFVCNVGPIVENLREIINQIKNAQ